MDDELGGAAAAVKEKTPDQVDGVSDIAKGHSEDPICTLQGAILLPGTDNHGRSHPLRARPPAIVRGVDDGT